MADQIDEPVKRSQQVELPQNWTLRACSLYAGSAYVCLACVWLLYVGLHTMSAPIKLPFKRLASCWQQSEG